MAISVEDGTGVPGADSYISVDDAGLYCTARGLTFADGADADKEAALRRATAALDAMYRSRFPGSKANGRSQSLEWPRTGAEDAEGEEISDDEVPVEVLNAVCEMAVRELAEPGSMLPDLERGGQVRALKAGSVSIEYGANAEARTTFQLIDGLLSGLLGAQVYPFAGTAIRG